MLVLSRYRDESIHIGNDVVVTIVDIRGDRVRIGVEAPSDVSVHRREVYEAIKNGGQKSDAHAKDERSAASVSATAPLSQELNKRKAKISVELKALPVDIESPVKFGGLTDIVQ